MGLIITVAVLMLIFLLMLLWVRLSIIFDGDGGRVTVRILFFKITLFGKEKKRINKNDFKIKKFNRRRKKAIRKYQRLLEKRKKKAAKKTVKESKPVKKVSKRETVNKLIDIFAVFLKKFPEYLRIDCVRLIVGVGGADAARVAINYGVTVQSVQYVGSLLNEVTNFKAADNDKISVYPDFTDGKWSADINIVMRLRVIHIIKLGIILLKQYLTQKTKKKTK